MHADLTADSYHVDDDAMCCYALDPGGSGGGHSRQCAR
jgi:hypothetical protein